MGKHSVPRGEYSSQGKPNGSPQSEPNRAAKHGRQETTHVTGGTQSGDRPEQSRLWTFLNRHLRK